MARGKAKLLERGARKKIDVQDGMVLVGSDGHYWPGRAPTGHRAFVWGVHELRPVAVVYNGDAFDGATISRHARIGWEKAPSVEEELEVCLERLGEIETAAGAVPLVWPAGNHDMRFETYLANRVPEYCGVKGIHLKDHFPAWDPCWSVEIGGRYGAIAKHRWKGGVHAARNNALGSGRTIITAHRHALQCSPVTDYNETRWGCDCGMLGDPYGPQFSGYCEDNPVDWRAGFLALTFHKGKLLPPEMVHVVGPKEVAFRGKVYAV